MKIKKNIEFKLRDLLPIYGLIKDYRENKTLYNTPNKDLNTKQANVMGLKLSFFSIYNAVVIKMAYDCLKNILNH
jgi:hypothetical protein